MYFDREEVSDDIKEILDLKNGCEVYVLKRLRLAHDVPVGIEEAFIPVQYCPELDKFDLTTSLYNLIKEEYSYTINYIDNVIEASKPTREEKEFLNITNNVPVLKITGINYTQSDLKLFYERSLYRSDEYKYNVRVYVNKT